MRRESVRITEEHSKRYKELANQGQGIAPAIRAIQKEFDMSHPHGGEAVRLWALRVGIEFPKAKKGIKPHTSTTVIPLKPQPDITLDQIEEFIILKIAEASEVNLLRNRLAATEAMLRNTQAELETLKRY